MQPTSRLLFCIRLLLFLFIFIFISITTPSSAFVVDDTFHLSQPRINSISRISVHRILVSKRQTRCGSTCSRRLLPYNIRCCISSRPQCDVLLFSFKYVEGDVSPHSSQLASEYMRCKSLCVILAVFTLLAPILTPPLPLDVSLLAWSTKDRLDKVGVLAMTAATSHILAGAADLVRLNSDTYKRLNLGLLFYCLLQLMSSYMELSSILYIYSNVIIRLVTVSTCFFGWVQGILTTSASSASFAHEKSMLIVKVCKELCQGTKQTIHGFYSRKEKGGPYPLMLIGCSLMILHSVGRLVSDAIILNQV